jgi:hypothetical protein
MIYELVKYRYGRGPFYTAFCLTPAVEPQVVSMGGRQFTVTNRGSHHKRARHFQSPRSAHEWAAANEVEIVGADWTPLEGAGVWPSLEQQSTNKARVASQ